MVRYTSADIVGGYRKFPNGAIAGYVINNNDQKVWRIVGCDPTKKRFNYNKNAYGGYLLPKSSIQIIEKYFPNAEITYEKDKVFIEYVCKNDVENIMFDIDPAENSLHLQMVRRCNGQRGTYHLKNIIQLARELGLQDISLTDISLIIYGPEELGCSIPLYTTHIIMHGESWYNKYGFVSDEHSSNYIHNNKIRNLRVNDFLYQIYQTYIESLNELIRRERTLMLDANYKKINTIYGIPFDKMDSITPDNFIKVIYNQMTDDINPNDTAAEFVTKLYNKYLSNTNSIPCNTQKGALIINLINNITKITKYSPFLTLKL